MIAVLADGSNAGTVVGAPEHQIIQKAVEKAELDRVYAPIGQDIADALPSEIAVALLAEILPVKNKGKLRHKKHIQ